jgi:hypothetical protein
MNADPGTAKAAKQAAREARRAAALRENLRRRKAQARARTAEEAGSAGTEGEPEGAQTPRRESEP